MDTSQAPPPAPRILLAGLTAALAAWLGQRLGGATVERAPDGTAALAALERGGWALLVLDHQLVGPSAMDVLRQARATHGAKTPPILYCLDRVAGRPLVQDLVATPGVYRLLYQPVDREELARATAECLHLTLAPTSPPSSAEQRTAAAVAAMWQRFQAPILERVAVIEQATAALLQDHLNEALRERAFHEAHRLAGSVGTFGFAEGSRLAREAEHLLQRPDALGPAEALRLADLVSKLRRELDQTPADELPVTAPADEGHLLIVDDDALLAERLVAESAGRGLRATVAADVAAARAVIAADRPDGVLLDLSFPAGAESGLTLLAELAARTPPLPVVVYTAREGFTDRLEVARLGGRAFLQKPVPATQVIEAVAQVLQQARATEATVMVVDDDPHVLALLRTLLEPRRIQLITVEESLRFWDALEESPADLLVLDVDMPHLNGIELCRVVRNDPRWRELPVLFLTAFTDADTVRRVFAAGADDYVSKPIVGPELVARIMNRLERTQLHRSMAETDALTGVSNRRKSDQVLTQFLRLAERHGQPLSLAILDLDHFKQVNDRYGHAAGDAVLRRLGRLLLRSFRGEDVVARWGGEEFVVGMYGMQRAGAVPRLGAVLAALRAEEFATPTGDRWQVSFSAGVAEYPADGADVQSLYRAADQALYRAKQAGRNQVLPTGEPTYPPGPPP
jgi:diguanylate cyclase (GGDEF)-like protein